MTFTAHLLITFEIYAIVALSLNLMVGHSGLLSLAHAGFFAVGGYVYALLTIKLGWAFLPAAFSAGLIGGVLSLTISLPSWRLRGDFLVLATLAVQALIFSGIYNWATPNAPIGTWANLTNGPFGITQIPRTSLLGRGPAGTLATTTLVLASVAWAVRRLTHSPWGRLLACMRDDELAARGLGKNTRLLKVEVIAVSCAFAALAGVLYAGHITYLDPGVASLDEGILMLSMVIIGGAGNFRGPLVGAAVLVALPELLRFLMLPDALAGNLRLGIYGLLLVLMVHLRPQGLAGVYRAS